MPRTTLLSNIPTARRDESNLYTDSMVKRRPVSCSDTTRPTQDRNHCGGKIDADKRPGRYERCRCEIQYDRDALESVVDFPRHQVLDPIGGFIRRKRPFRSGSGYSLQPDRNPDKLRSKHYMEWVVVLLMPVPVPLSVSESTIRSYTTRMHLTLRPSLPIQQQEAEYHQSARTTPSSFVSPSLSKH